MSNIATTLSAEGYIAFILRRREELRKGSAPATAATSPWIAQVKK